MQSNSWLPDEYYLTEYTLALYTAENVQGGVMKTLLTINSKRILQHFFLKKHNLCGLIVYIRKWRKVPIVLLKLFIALPLLLRP